MSQKLPALYLVSAARTAIGSFQGAYASLSAPDLGAVAIRGALSRAKLDPSKIEEVFMGNVLTAGIGQAPARQAMIKAGIPNTTPATTIGKVCGSGLQALVFGARALAVGDANVIVTGGMESMTNSPYYLMKARDGYRMGNGQLIDGMIHDGLWDPYGNVHMGNCGELCAKEHGFSREAQDDYARESYRRAVAAQKEGLFAREIEPVLIAQRKGDPLSFALDEEPAKGDPTKFGGLRPAFDKSGTITAAKISMGAVAPTQVQVDPSCIIGSKLDDAALARLDAAAQAVCNPIDDKRGTIEFRTKVAGVLARRTAAIAVARAGGR